MSHALCNCIRLALAAAMPAALLCAGAANAQTSPQSAPTPPQSVQSGETPRGRMQPRSSTPLARMPDSGAANRTNHMEDSPDEHPGNFSALAGTRGYVTQSGAASDAWLARHFSRCDTNHDGKVTRAEYDQCRKQNPPQP